MIPFAFLAISAAVHLATIILLSLPPPEKKKEEKPKIPNVVSVQIKEKGKGTVKCEETYSGVGFMYNIFTQLIVDAPPSYPAYKAGIRIGDFLLDPGKPRSRKGPTTIRVKRDGKLLVFKIPQEEVCVDGLKR